MTREHYTVYSDVASFEIPWNEYFGDDQLLRIDTVQTLIFMYVSL